MDAGNADVNARRVRTNKRKEILEKKKIVDGLIKAASSLKNPLASFPSFHHHNHQGLCLHLETGCGDKLSRPLKKYIQKLLKLNMEKHYGTEWPTEEKVKHREMVAPDARYIFVYEIPNLSKHEVGLIPMNEHMDNVIGFAHYRFAVEEALPVVYVYELQLEQHVQGKGVGKFLMEILELIARKNCMAAVILTVQKANMPAISFYTNKMNYCVSAISPSRADPMVGAMQNYEILCKTFNEEAKTKLE